MDVNEKLLGLAPDRISRFIGETLQPLKIDRRRLLVICVAVFAVAVGVRLLHWQNNRETVDNLMAAIVARYQEEAQPLVNGDLRTFVRGSSAQPDTAILTRTPGYPIFIAAVQTIAGNSNRALRLVQIMLGAAAAVLIVLLAIELLPPGAAVLAGMFAAISPQLSFYSLVLLADSIAVVPVLVGMYLLVRARKQPQPLTIITAGFALGVACWFRANTILLPFLLALIVMLLFPRPIRLRYALMLLAASLLAVAPITLRNAIVFRSFVPLALGTGHNLTAGIADYDPGKRFGLESYDHTAAQQEAALYNRPDYANDLYRPDGIVRERLRVGRAWAVIKANKIWFSAVMARRAAKMLTYEPVSIVSTEPSITNSMDTTKAQLAWRASPDLGTNPTDVQVMLLSAQPGSAPWATFPVQRNSDYLLSVPVRPVEGRTVISLIPADNGRALASATIPDSLDPAAPKIGTLTVLSVPFVNASADRLNLIVTKPENDNTGGNTIEVGSIQLYRLGPASYLWTRYPRVLVKSFQKLFTTGWMLPLALFGVVLFAAGRRFDALAIICAVPIYFLCTHAPLHLELRYILPINYFWGVLVATSLYFIFMTGRKLFRTGTHASGVLKWRHSGGVRT